MTYNGQVNFGLIGDYDAMADLDSFALDLEASIGELFEASGAGRRRLFRRERAGVSSNGHGTPEEAAASQD